MRHGRRKAFHLYHVCSRGEICFEDMAPAVGWRVPRQRGSVAGRQAGCLAAQDAKKKIFYLLLFFLVDGHRLMMMRHGPGLPAVSDMPARAVALSTNGAS